MATAYLVDASPYIFRAYFSLPSSMTDPEGNPVNAVRGFGDMLLRLAAQESPTHVAVAFDGSLTTSFRNDVYPAYKSSRELPPAELEAQLKNCQALSEALGFASYIDARYEADDIVATLAARLRPDGHSVVVVSGDKDLSQLVDEGTQLLDVAKGALLDEDGVREKMGVRPDQVRDFLGLAGDSVDDIPGVRGVGPKSATALLGAYDHLEDIYDDLDGVEQLAVRGAKSLRKKLEEHRDMAFLSRDLATLSLEAPVAAGLGELEWAGADASRLDPLLERLGLERLRDRVPRWKDA